MRLRRKQYVFDPVGWDPVAGLVHDLSLLPSSSGAVLLHHSTCWCRRAPAEGSRDGD